MNSTIKFLRAVDIPWTYSPRLSRHEIASVPVRKTLSRGNRTKIRRLGMMLEYKLHYEIWLTSLFRYYQVNATRCGATLSWCACPQIPIRYNQDTCLGNIMLRIYRNSHVHFPVSQQLPAQIHSPVRRRLQKVWSQKRTALNYKTHCPCRVPEPENLWFGE